MKNGQPYILDVYGSEEKAVAQDAPLKRIPTPTGKRPRLKISHGYKKKTKKTVKHEGRRPGQGSH